MYRLLRICILAVLFVSLYSVGFADINPHNGVAYVLLPKDYSGIHGVYRLNSFSDPYAPLLGSNGRRLFDLNFGGAVVVNGLAVNQSSKIYLFVGPNVTGVYAPVDEVGWVPSGRFEADSPAFTKLIGQPFSAAQVSQDVNGSLGNLSHPYGTTNYDNDFWDYGPEVWPHSHKLYKKGSYTDAAGNSYQYMFDPYAPATHKGLPLWNGPGPSAAGIAHPTDPYKVILPNKWGGVAWYAFGSPNAPAAHVGKLMDGTDGRPVMDQYDFRLSHTNRGNYSPYGDAKYISCVVRRVYEKRDRSLDLYAYLDNVIPPAAAPYSNYPGLEASSVLTATDLKITEQYGKSCADGCIPGGALNPEAIGKIESCVQVFTSTTGRRYGFNPFGKKTGPFGVNDAALRVVHSGTTYNLNFNSTNIRNNTYFTSYLNVPLERATIVGVSSKFETPSTPISVAPDHLYASIADKFCIQDSWWGNGGIAYEYYSKDAETDAMTFKAGHIYRLNYLETTSPVPEDVGKFDGDIDAIAVDGHGNLYILYTELNCPNDPVWPDPTGLPQGPDIDKVDPKVPGNPIIAHADFLSVGSWMRPGDGVPDEAIAGPALANDYITVKFKQRVQKVCRKYTPSAGGGFSLSTVEERGHVNSSFDAIKKNLKYNGDGTFDWINAWHHEYGTGSRSANIDAEFAVVNIAERPSNYNLDPSYSICRYDRIKPDSPIDEDTEVVFKVEGYRPYGADGNIQHLINAGTIPTLGNVYVNLIPPYENRDEDGDGNRGGFPSGFFENNAAYKLNVKWHVELIEPSAAYDPAKVIKRWEFDPDTGDLQKRLTFKFPQPGNYAVFAELGYSYFNYDALGANERPNDLVNYIVNRSGIFTQKILYHVQSPSNTVTDGYISDITLNTGDKIQGAVTAGGQSGYILLEDNAANQLNFTFTAQFIRDANVAAAGSKYETYTGVGAWDYGLSPHVYNRNADGTVNNNVLNPGRKKYLSEVDPAPPALAQYQCGTRVDVDPNDRDFAAFKWRLLIYPPYYNASNVLVSDTPLVLGEGNCSGATVVTNHGDQKYTIRYNIPATALQKLMTPIDHEAYKVRLEIEYPRVKWIESTPAAGVTQAQFRSIVPDSPPMGLISNEPGSVGNANLGKDSTPGMFAGGIDSWMLCARDTTIVKPAFEGIAFDGVTPVTQIATHTTGDPTPACLIKVGFEDNNPNSAFSDLRLNYELPQAKRDLISKTDGNFANGSQLAAYGPKPTVPNYYNDDNYKIQASYSFTIPEYGGDTGSSILFDPGMNYQHWIGSLSFSLEGNLFDGHDADGRALTSPHVFSKTAVDDRLRTYACGLIRYDNDPPSLIMNIVSQADNRRWEIRLNENNTDLVANPSTDAQLSPASLTVRCFKISDGSAIYSPDSVIEPGSSNFPVNMSDNEHVTLMRAGFSADFVTALPAVRRSSRIMVSGGFADNVDYQAFTQGSISVIELTGAGTNNLLATTSLGLSAYPDDDKEKCLQFDRGRHYIDVPMQIRAGQDMPTTPQLVIHLTATDSSGNKRSLTVPVRVVDSTFDARVLESNEGRQ